MAYLFFVWMILFLSLPHMFFTNLSCLHLALNFPRRTKDLLIIFSTSQLLDILIIFFLFQNKYAQKIIKNIMIIIY